MKITKLSEEAMDEMDSDELTVNIDDTSNFVRDQQRDKYLLEEQIQPLKDAVKAIDDAITEAANYHNLLWDKKMIALRRERSSGSLRK